MSSPPFPPAPLVPTDNQPRLVPAAPEEFSHRKTLCGICSSTDHMKRNCPQVKCAACGASGHFKYDCPEDETKRTRPMDGDGVMMEDDYRCAVCHGCGSSRHIQANCPVRYQTLECHQCHQRGHMMITCPLTRCFNCGTFGHSSQICHSKQQCFHCSNAGHRSADCPMKHKGRVCYQCKEPGHEAANCPQGQLCRMCRQPGHLIAHCPAVTCNNCKEKGHTSGVCEKKQCVQCGGNHDAMHCDASYLQDPSTLYEEEVSLHDVGPAALGHEARGGGEVDNNSSLLVQVDPLNQSASLQLTSLPPYISTGAPRTGRVAVVIDGPYFENILRHDNMPSTHTEEYYSQCVAALQYTLQYIGDILGKEPIAYWYDTDPTAFTDFLETAMPLAHREKAFKETAMRRRYLTDEMNGDGALPNVVARLVGGMKRQYGYTKDGPGYVWVQTGVDVAIATCVVELFLTNNQFQQVLLLCGDSDVYPAVHYCNTHRRTSAMSSSCPPVRVCGTSSSMAKQYGQHQDLSDFLPRILLDKPHHTECSNVFEFLTHKIFI